jgi:Family of unknown function (DUF5317)
MLLLIALALGLVAGLATGGRIGNLANLRFRWPFFVVVVLIIREGALINPFSRIDGVQYLYAVSLVALVAWTLLHVRLLPGVWLVSIGACLNLIVVLANGSRMPVAPALAGVLVSRGHIGQYEVMGPDSRLNLLADWIGVPGPLGGAYSPGDIMVAAGIALVAFLATRRQAVKPLAV